MKIILVFDLGVSYESGAIYLVEQKLPQIPDDVQIIVSPHDVDSFELRDELNLFKNYICSHISDKLIIDAFSANFSNFYLNIFRNTYKWVWHLQNLQKKYGEIHVVISDFVKGNYLPFYESEGEVNSMLFYKKYDFIPQIVAKYLYDNKIDYKIIKSHTRVYQLVRIFLRRFCLFWIKPVVYIVKNLTLRQHRKSINGPHKIILLSRSIAHTHLFFPLQETSNKFMTLYNDGFFSKGTNHSFFLKHHGKGIQLFIYLRLFNIFKNFILIHKALITTYFMTPRYVAFKGLHLPLISLIREMLISYFDALIYADSLDSFLNKNPNTDLVVTGETFTQFPYVLGKLLKNKNIKFIQYECGALNLMPNVEFVFGQKFLISSESVLLKYRELHPNEAYKMQFWGNTKQIATGFRNSKVFRKIIYFSQPFEYESQSSILKCLHQVSIKYGIKVDIKPHPRDYEIIKIAENYGFDLIDKTSFFSEYIGNYDLAIARTSSIVKDIILSRIPFLIALFSNQEQGILNEFITPNYIRKYKEVYIFDEACLNDSIIKPHEINKVCNSFFENFKIDNSSLDLEQLSSRIIDYSKELKV